MVAKLPSFKRYIFEMVDGPLDGLKLVSRDYNQTFPAMLSFTYVLDDDADKCRVIHYKFAFQYARDDSFQRVGAVFMHNKTVDVNVKDGEDR